MINLLISEFAAAETPFVWSSSMCSCADEVVEQQGCGASLAVSCSGIMDEGARS